MESNDYQATLISRYYMTLGDENHLEKMQEGLKKQDECSLEELNQRIKTFASNYIRPHLMHKGCVLPIPHSEQDYWRTLQQRSDDEDSRILSGRVRNSPVEPGKYVHTVSDATVFSGTYPKPRAFILKNGIKVYAYHTSQVPVIKFNVCLKNSLDSELWGKQHLIGCLFSLFDKIGTKRREASELQQLFENLAISHTIDGTGLYSSMLSDDFRQAVPLLLEALTEPVFDEESLSKIKAEQLSAYESSFDDEEDIKHHLINNAVYTYPFYNRHEKLYPEKIKSITLDDIKNAYVKKVSPDGARIFIVGNIGDYAQMVSFLDATFGAWQGAPMPQPECSVSTIEPPVCTTHYLDRDQTILAFAGPSISRSDPDYFPLVLYEVHLQSRLFALRELTGAFYRVSGQVVGDAGFDPGLAYIGTIVSPDRCEEVQHMIRDFIQNDSERFSQEDLELAQRTVIKKRDQRFVDNDSLMNTFMWLDNHDLPFDYDDMLPNELKSITVDDVKRAAKRVFNVHTMSTFLIGRIGKPGTCSVSQPINLESLSSNSPFSCKLPA